MRRKKKIPKIDKTVKTWGDIRRLKRLHKFKKYYPPDNEIADIDLALEAYKHTTYMSKHWSQLTKESSVHSCYRTERYDGGNRHKVVYNKMKQIYDKGIKCPKVIIMQAGLLDAALNVDDGRNMCIVSPTYHNYVCSGYIYGHKNIETDLCRESNLFNVASNGRFYRLWSANRIKKRQRRGMYQNTLFYLHKILFERDDIMRRYDVILCWPPKSRVNYQQGITHNEVEIIIKKRLKYIMSVAEEYDTSTIIFNDWGCDDYLLNNPYTVAKAFKKAIRGKQIERVVFAIDNKEHYRIFKYVFENDVKE